MGIRVIDGDWPRTPSEHAVKRWMDKVGIDHTLLLGYEITARNKDVSTIKLELNFNEDIDAEVTGLDKEEREFLPTGRV